MLRRKFFAVLLAGIATCGAGALAQQPVVQQPAVQPPGKALPKAGAQVLQPFTERAQRNSFLTYPNACFPAGGDRFVIERAPAVSPEECVQRCDAMGACAAYEIWEHTKVCKLYSDAPGAPVHQQVFPQNKVDNRQAQAWLGVKRRF